MEAITKSKRRGIVSGQDRSSSVAYPVFGAVAVVVVVVVVVAEFAKVAKNSIDADDADKVSETYAA